jgi:hypothetical protein
MVKFPIRLRFVAEKIFVLMAVMLPMTHDAQAGTYTTSYTGGQKSTTGGYEGTTSSAYSFDSSQSRYGGFVNGQARPPWGPNPSPSTAQCSGAITASFTWQPDIINDPPPECIIVRQQASASCSANGGTIVGHVDTGLGDSADAGSQQSVSRSSVRYSVVYNPGGTITCSPSATVGSSVALINASVYYSAVAYPITMLLGGVTKGADGSDNILIGQRFTPTLVGFPSDCTISNYQWSVTGPTFQSWTVNTYPNNPNHSYTAEVDGPGNLAIPNPGWYWRHIGSNDSHSETVSCTATVTPPTGKGAPFQVSLTGLVRVWTPDWECSGTGGCVKITTKNSEYWMLTSPLNPQTETGGMVWRATVASPYGTPYPNSGTLKLVQLFIPGMSFVSAGNNYHWYPDSVEGLDTIYPYPWVTDGPDYMSRDTPGFGLSPTVIAPAYAASASLTDQFEDYLLYTPPGSSQCVPLGHFVWSTDGHATEPNAFNVYSWSLWDPAVPAGPVTPSGTATDFLPSNSFPEWIQNNAIANGYWVGG